MPSMVETEELSRL